MKLSGNFTFPTMLQSVAWLSLFVFESLKIENCNRFKIFVFRPKHSKSLTEPPKREGEGSMRTVIFAPSALPTARSASLLKGFGKEVRVYLSPRSFTTFWSVFLSSIHYSEQPDFGR